MSIPYGLHGPLGDDPAPVPPWVTHRYIGSTVVVAGAAVAVLSFLFLPYQVGFGMFTAPEVIKLNAENNAAWNLVWLTPLVSAAAGVIALLQQGRVDRPPSTRIDAFIRVRTLAALVVGVHLLDIVVLAFFRSETQDLGLSVVNLLGIGFWFGLFGMIVTYVGATIELRNLLQWKSQSATNSGWR